MDGPDCVPNLLVRHLAEQDKNTFYDATLTDQDGGRHHVSKMILSAHSDFFLKLFTDSHPDQVDFQLQIVKRSSDSAAGLRPLLAWMEAGSLELEADSVVDVLETAEYLQLLPASALCQQWLAARPSSTCATAASSLASSSPTLTARRATAYRPRPSAYSIRTASLMVG